MSLRTADKITVRVTRADIEAGISNTSDLCPVALALRREHPRVRNLAVDTDHVYLGQWVWDLSSAAESFIRRFDKHEIVEPMTITLVKEG